MVHEIDRHDIASSIARISPFAMHTLIPHTLEWHDTTRQTRYRDAWKRDTHFLPMTERIAPVSSALPLESYEGSVRPMWMRRLDAEHLNLQQQLTARVDVTDFGAVGDGQTDCTRAFRQALKSGRHVFVPEGVYVVSGVRIPSLCVLEGAGQDKTILRLADHAPKHRRLLRNATPRLGNHHIEVAHLTLDWNVSRLGQTKRTTSGDTASSAFMFAHVTYGWVHHVKAMAAGLHAFDITSPHYHYLGDGLRGAKGSRYIHLDSCEATDYGDDGITTHHSDAIYISNCYCHHPHGRTHAKGFSNSNGIEIDDGSRHVVLANNMSEGCFGGVEIKAHGTSSAAHDVHIFGHISLHDNRSFNFRHIGHHLADDPDSQTARFISGTNLISIEPIHTDLYVNSAPRSLVISAYQDVLINGFTAIGDPEYDYRRQPLLAIQYKSRRIRLERLDLSGFRHARADLELFGGNNRTDVVHIKHVFCHASAPIGIQVGRSLTDVAIEDATGTQTDGDRFISTRSPIQTTSLAATGFRHQLFEDEA